MSINRYAAARIFVAAIVICLMALAFIAFVREGQRQSQEFHEAVARQHHRSAMVWKEIFDLMDQAE